MKFHILRLGEIDDLAGTHPVLETQKPDLADPLLPAAKSDDPDFPIAFYAEEEGKLACYFRSFPDVLHLDGNPIPFAWNGNLMTLPDFRRRGLAQTIVEKQIEEFDRRSIVWGGVFSSAGALHLYNKLSFTMVGFCPRLCYFRQLAPILSHHMPEPVAKAAGMVGKVGMKTLDLTLRLRQPFRGKTELREISPTEFATLSENTTVLVSERAQWDTSADWLVRRQAVRAIDRIFLVHQSGETDPIGYILLRQRKNIDRPIREKYFGVDTMTLTHYGVFKDTPDTLEILTAAALDHFWASTAELFEIVTNSGDMERAARRAGMIPLGKGMSFKFMEPSALKDKLPRDLASYKLTHYSGDAYSFE